MRLEFVPLYVRPDVPTYGATHGMFTYVITLMDTGKFHASVKPVGAVKFDGQREDLGTRFSSFTDAVKACEDHARKQEQ